MAEDDVLDPRQAAELLRRSADHARERLMVHQPLIYGAWGLAWLIGFGALFAIIGAASHFGASAKVMGVLGAAGPLLLVGLIYMVAAGMWLDRVMFWLGVWALVVAAAGAWTGPVGVLFMDAVAGGGGFLAASALTAWRNRT